MMVSPIHDLSKFSILNGIKGELPDTKRIAMGLLKVVNSSNIIYSLFSNM